MLWPSALRVLQNLGFREVGSLGAPIHESILRDRRGRGLLRIPLGLRRDSLPRVVPRSALMQVLDQAFAGDRVVAAATAIHREGGRFEVALTDGTTRAFDHVVVATGMHGAARHGLTTGCAPRYCGRNSWRGLCSLENATLAEGVAVETIGRGCRVGLFPVGNGLVYWFVQRNQRERTARLDDPGAELMKLLADWPQPIPAVLEATPRSAMLETPIEEVFQPRWWSEGCLTIGDAAHGMTPDLGRGACAAIVNLGDLDRRLAQGSSFAMAASSYARARRWRTRLVQAASRRAGEVRQIELRWLHDLRNGFWRFFPPLWILRNVIAPLVARRTRPDPVRNLESGPLPSPQR